MLSPRRPAPSTFRISSPQHPRSDIIWAGLILVHPGGVDEVATDEIANAGAAWRALRLSNDRPEADQCSGLSSFKRSVDCKRVCRVPLDPERCFRYCQHSPKCCNI